jgi:effector-binding domain-containing protein
MLRHYDEIGLLGPSRVDPHTGNMAMSSLDVTIKTTEPIRIAEASATAAGFGYDNLNPVFERLVPDVLGHFERVGAPPGIMVAWYEDPADDGSIIVHAGFDIADHNGPDGDRVRVVDLPAIKVASVVHRGPIDNIGPVYEALVRWIEDSGNQLAGRSRELYHHWDDADPNASVTELQMPLAR